MPKIEELSLEDLKQIYKKYMRDDFPLMELRPWFSIERAWERGGYEAYGYYEDDKLLAYASFYTCRDSACVLFDYLAVIPELRGRGIGTEFLGELLPEVSSGQLSEVISGLPLGSESEAEQESLPRSARKSSPGSAPGSSPGSAPGSSPEVKIFGEVENVASAKNEEERGTRQKRIDFYLRNGAVMTGVNCHLFGVDYNIMRFRAEGQAAAKPECETTKAEQETAKAEAPKGEAAADEYYDVICEMYRELYRPVYGRLCRPYLDGTE